MATPLAALAKKIRYCDWWAVMADDIAVWRRHDEELRDIREEVARLGKNAARLWELGKNVPKMYDHSVAEAERVELAWRWAGAYCWAHGVRLTEAEARELAQIGRIGLIDWKHIDARIKGA
jgi:hypothetical protein